MQEKRDYKIYAEHDPSMYYKIYFFQKETGKKDENAHNY